MNIKNTYNYIIMSYTYEKIIEISLKLDKSKNKLNEPIMLIINNLKRQLNIPVIEILKKTIGKKHYVSIIIEEKV